MISASTKERLRSVIRHGRRILVAAVALYGAYKFIDRHISQIVATRVDWQMRPMTLRHEAVACFSSGREIEGFDNLSEALAEYRSRKTSHERASMEEVMHDYVYYLSASNRPFSHKERLAYILGIYKETGSSYSIADQMNIAWYHFKTGNVSRAQELFKETVYEANRRMEPYDAALAYDGLRECALASGDPHGAIRCWDAAADLDPGSRLRIAYNKYDQYTQQAEQNYQNTYRSSLIAFIQILNERDTEKTKQRSNP